MRKKEDLSKYDNLKDQFIDLYCNQLIPQEEIAQRLNISVKRIPVLIEYFNLRRDPQAAKSKSLQNNSKKQANYNNIKSRITKEIIEQWYIIEDNDYKLAPEHFNINQSMFDKLCRDYGIRKDKSKSRYKGLITATKKYGKGNSSNWIKGQQTRIKNYGSLEESYRQGFEKIKQTNLEKYGSEVVLNLYNHAHKINSQPNEQFEKLISDIPHEREFILETKAYDFKVNNILIEINPTVTHNTFINYFNKQNNYIGLNKNYHVDKSNLAEKHNYRCIHVWDWDDINKIKNIITPRETIYARNCIIKQISRSEAEQFLNKHHLQNYARCSIRFGLYYEDQLVACMTFGKPRYNKNYEWELIRYCSIKNIIGGSEKLFKYFINIYNPSSIISYCDKSKFIGNTYNKLGFKYKYSSAPTCHWYNIKIKQHITDALLRKEGFSRLINKCDAKEDNLETNDNKELILKAGFLPVYDCGQAVYVWEKAS